MSTEPPFSDAFLAAWNSGVFSLGGFTQQGAPRSPAESIKYGCWAIWQAAQASHQAELAPLLASIDRRIAELSSERPSRVADDDDIPEITDFGALDRATRS